MTTPTNSPEPGGEEAPPPEQPIAPIDAEAATATAPPPEPAPVGPAPPPGFPWAPASDPFAPEYRAPRTPWINPTRRAHVVAVAIVGALVFGGGGLLIGHALSGDGNGRRTGVMKFEHGHGDGQGRRHGHGYGRDGHRFGPGQGPRYPGGPGQLPSYVPAPTVAPTPAASSTR